MNNRQETKIFYNQTAKKAFGEWFNNPALMPTLKSFIDNFSQKPLILDLGCGTGGESKRLIHLGSDVIGIDFSEDSLEIAIKNVPKAKFLIMDILDIKFEDNCFDGVVEAGVLFHFTESEQNHILDKIFSILKQEGKFLSYYPEGAFEGMQQMDVAGEFFRRYARYLQKSDWIKQVMKNGFKKYVERDFDIGSFKCVEFSK